MSTWDELNKQAKGGAPAVVATTAKKSTPKNTAGGWDALNASAIKQTQDMQQPAPEKVDQGGGLNKAGQKAFFGNPFDIPDDQKMSQDPDVVKPRINIISPISIDTKTANSTQMIPDEKTPNIGVNDVIGAPVGFLGGAIGGAIGAVGGAITEKAKGKTGKDYWNSVGKDSVNLAKEVYKFGSDIVSAGAKLGVATAVAPELVGAYFTAMTGKGIYDTIVKTKQYAQDLQDKNIDHVGIRATYKYLQEGGAEGWRLIGADDKLINALNDNSFFNAVGNVLLYGGAYFAAKGTYEGSKAPVARVSDFLTKQKITEYKLPETVTISPQEVYDIYSGKAGYENNLTVQEKGDLLSTLGLTSQEISNARKNGITITKPTEVVVKLADKPWFAKIKDKLNIDSTPRIISKETIGGSKQAPVALLNEGVKVVDNLKSTTAEMKTAIEEANNTGNDVPLAITEKASLATKNFNDFVNNNKTQVLSYEGNKTMEGSAPKLNIETVKFGNNRFGVSYEAVANGSSLVAPFDPSFEYKSSQQAVLDATKKINDWIDQQDTNNEQSRKEISDIKQALSDFVNGKKPEAMIDQVNQDVKNISAKSLGFKKEYNDMFDGYDYKLVDKNIDIKEAQKRQLTLSKKYGYDLQGNQDGTITLYHGTTPENAKRVLKNGFDDEQLFASPSTELNYGGVNGAGYYGDAILKFDVDPRDLVFRQNGEYYIEYGKGATNIELVKNDTKKFKTIHQGGEIKMVDGNPVKIIDGLETFLHKGDGGWVVSEVSTGRYLADGKTEKAAVASAKAKIEEVGNKKFKKLLEQHKLEKQTEKPKAKEIGKKPETKKTEPKKEPAKPASEIKDFGEKIGGANKERWAKRGILTSDLTGMNDREIARNLKKENVWIKNYDELKSKGTPDEIIMFTKRVRDSLTAKIGYTYRDNTPELKQARNEQYINFINEVKDAVSKIKSVNELPDFYRNFVIDNGYAKMVDSTYGGGQRLEYTDKQKSNPFLTDKFRKAAKVSGSYEMAKLVREAKKQQFGVRPEDKMPKGIEPVYDDFKKEWFVARRSGRFGSILKTGFATEVEAAKWIKENLSDLKNRVSTKQRFTPPQLADIHREGFDYRNGNTKNITGEDYQKTFGFKGGEFGNWMTPKDRQVSLNFGYDALMDLSDALGISRKDISLGNTLSISFGSRGRAGAAAHYEPDRKVFNLTKMNGAGSTAHEWFHALEDYLGKDGKTFEAFNDLKRSLRFKEVDGKQVRTNFYQDSIGADSYFSKAGGYWQSEEEMLARAFASYITDKTNGKSDYLSGHSESAVYIGKNDEVRNAFPTGEERKVIDEKFDRFFADLKDRGIFTQLTEKGSGQSKYSIKNATDFANPNKGIQALDDPFDGELLFRRLQKDMKRLGLDFDIALFDKIYTGEMAKRVKISKDGIQTLRVIPEEAAGVAYNNQIALAKVASRFTEKHELIHIISRNMSDIPAFSKYDKNELLQEAGKVYGKKYQDSDLEEVLARGFEDFVYRRQTFAGKLRSFFEQLLYQVKQIIKFTRRTNLKSFYEDVLYSKSAETTNLRRGASPIGRETVSLGKKTLDFSREPKARFSKKTVDDGKFDPEKYVEEKTRAAKEAAKADYGGIIGKLSHLTAEAKSKLVDFTAPIEDTLNASVKKNKLKLKPSEDIHNNIDRVLRYPTLAGQFVKDTGLDKVIREVDNIDNLDQYLIAKHAIELDAKGIETGRDLEKDKMLIEAFKGKYDPFAKKVTEYSHKILDYSVESGLISPELSAKLKEIYPDYVPFNRVFNEMEKHPEQYGGKAVASLSKQSIVQKISGSTREIESPIGSLLNKTSLAFKQGEKNKAAKVLISYEKLPGNPFGLEMVTEDRPKKVGEETISYLNNGQKITYVVRPDVARAAKALDVQRLNVLGQIFALPTRVARLGITSLNIPFVVGNIMKDQVTAFINSNNGVKTSILNPKLFVQALVEVAGKGKIYEEIERSGAGGTSYDISRNQIEPTIKRIRSERSVFSKIAYKVTRPMELIRTLEDLISKSEEFTRTKQYIGTKNELLRKGYSEEEARIGAARAYNEDTVNFARRGEWGQVLNSAFLYLNAGIQGTRNLVGNLRDKPGSTITKIAIGALFPMAVATLYNLKDEKRKQVYDDIPEWEKQNNIIIVPDGAKKNAQGKYDVIKIPMSQEVNNLTGFVRKWIESMHGYDKVGFSSLASAIFGTVTPFSLDIRQTASQLTPQALKPTIEALSNTDLYSGNKIVSDYLKNLPPEQQVYDNTSGTARKIGAALGVSPLQVEHFLKQTFGEIALQAENTSDKILNALGIIPRSQIGGRGIVEGTIRRFGTASGGQLDQKTKDSMNLSIGERSVALSQAEEKFQPTFDDIQTLLAEGKDDQAQALVNGLTDAEYVTYKLMKKKMKTAETNATKVKLYPTYLKVQDLISQGKENEAQSIVDAMSDSEYKAYKSLKNTMAKPTSDQPSLDQTGAKDGIAAADESSFLSKISLYAKAIGTDPLTAFNRIFTGQRIVKLTNGAIIVERMPLSESSKIKKNLGGSSEYQLDHIIPLELGGSNSEDNLVLIPVKEAKELDRLENDLGDQLSKGEITKDEAQKKMREAKKDYIK